MGRRVLAVALAATLLLPAGCGDSEASYCDALAKSQRSFADDGSGQVLLRGLTDFEKLAKKAPEDLTDEWQVFVSALRELRTALDDAGVDPSSIVGGKRPDAISETQWDAIRSAADGLASPAVTDAVAGIDQQAKDVCKIQLGLA